MLSTDDDMPRRSVEEAFRRLDEIGGPNTMPIHPRGWAQVSNTPFRLYKSFTHAGGRQVPCIVSWPSRLGDPGGLRSQYAHVTDVLPTVLDLVGAPPLSHRNGQRVVPMSGVTFAPALRDPDAASDHVEQYFERGGNLAYYRRGWEIVARGGAHPGLEEPDWELYHVERDPTEAYDLAREHPETVQELATRWEEAAWENQVFPLDDKTGLRRAFKNPAASHLSRPVTLYRSTATMDRHRSMQLIQTRSFRITILVAHSPGDEGVLVAHGDQGGGYIVYVEGGRVWFTQNHKGELRELRSEAELEAGDRTVTVDVTTPGGWVWDVSLSSMTTRPRPRYVSRCSGARPPSRGSTWGADRRSPVSWEMHQVHGSFPYAGTIHAVTYEPGDFAPDSPYRASPEEIRALARAIADGTQ